MLGNASADRRIHVLRRAVVGLVAFAALTVGLVMAVQQPARAELDPNVWDPIAPYASIETQIYYIAPDGKEYSGMEEDPILRVGDQFRIGLRVRNISLTPIDVQVGSLEQQLVGTMYRVLFGQFSCTPGGNPQSNLASRAVMNCVSGYQTVAAPIPNGKSGGGYSITVKDPSEPEFGSTRPVFWNTLAGVGKDSVALVQNDPTLNTTRTDGSVQPGDTIVFNFTATNDGDFPWSAPQMTDTLGLGYTCTPTTVNAGGTSTCTSTPYTVTTSDVAAGSVTNKGTISVLPQGSPTRITADSNTKTVPVVRAQTEGTAELTKTGPSSVARGGQVEYTLTVRNAGEAATTAPTVVSDPIPTQLDPASVTATTTAAGATINVNAGTATWNIPTGLAGGASVTATIRGTVRTDATPGTGVLVNTATVSSGACAGPACTSTVRSDITDTTGALTVTKTADKATNVHAGDTVVYTLRVENTGTGALHGIQVMDSTPQFAGDNIVCGTSTTGQIATLAQGASVNCTLTHTFTAAELTAGGPTWGTTGLTNTATAAGLDAQNVPVAALPASTTVRFAVSTETDVTKDATYTSPVIEGSVINYRVTVTYNGDGVLNNPRLNDPMIPNLSASCSPPIPASISKGFTTTCTATHTVTRADVVSNWATKKLTNTATFTGTSAIWPTEQVDEPASKDVPLADDGRDLVKFSGSKVASSTSANPGDTITYTVKAKNDGAVTASNVVITDTISGQPATTIPNSQCTWPATPGSLAPGAEATCTYTYTIKPTDANTTVHNTAAASGSDGATTHGPDTLGSADVVVSSGVSLTATKTNDAGAGNRVRPGGQYNYIITILNSGGSPATGVTVTDRLPVGLDFPAQSGWTFNSATREVKNTTGVTVAAGGSQELRFRVSVPSTATGPATYENIGAIDGTRTITECVASPTLAGCFRDTSVVLDDSDIVLEKKNSFPAGTQPLVKVGDTFSYTTTITNNGTSSKTVTITDVLPTGIEFASTTQAGWTFPTATRAVSVPVLVPGNDSRSLTLQVRVAANAPVGVNLLNIIADNDAHTPEECVANPDQPGCGKDDNPPKIEDHSKVTIEKKNSFTVPNPKVKRGDSFTYTITATNTGTDPVAGVRISDTLPVGLEFDGPQAADWTLDIPNRKATLTNPVTLQPGAAGARSWDLTVKVSSTAAAGVLQNIAVMDDQDPNNCSVANPSNACGVDPNPPTVDLSEVSMTKANNVPSGRVKAGDSFKYTFVVKNTGPQAAAGVVIRDWLPPSLELDPAVNQTARWGAIDANGIVTSTPFNLAANTGEATIELAVRVKTGTPVGTRIHNGGVVGDQTRPQDCTTGAVNLPGCALDPNPLIVDDSDIYITKQNKLAPPRLVKVGDTFSYDIIVENRGTAGSQQKITVNEQLPVGLAFEGTQDTRIWATVGTTTAKSVELTVLGQSSTTLPLTVRVTPAAVVGSQLVNVAAIDGQTDPGDCKTNADPGCAIDDNPPTVVDHSAVTIEKWNSIGGETPASIPTVKPNGTFSYTIRVKNTSTTLNAVGVGVTEWLPNFVSWDGNQSTDWRLTGNKAELITPITLLPGQERLYTFNVKVASNATGELKNIATLDDVDPTTCVTTGNPWGCAVDMSGLRVDNSNIAITKTNDLPGTRVKPEVPFTYTFTLQNTGTEAKSVTITDLLPVGLELVPASQSPTWGTLDPATRRIVSAPVNVPAGGAPVTVELKVQVIKGTAANTQIRNAGSIETPVEQCLINPLLPGCAVDDDILIVDDSTIQMEKTNDVGTPANVLRGQEFTYTITLRNTGRSEAQGVVINDKLPAGIAFSGAQDTSVWATANPTGDTITSRPLTIAGSGSATLPIKVKVLDTAVIGATLTNVAAHEGVSTLDQCINDLQQQRQGCAWDDTPVTVVDHSKVKISKSNNLPNPTVGTQPRVAPLQTFEYTIRAENSDTAPATKVVLRDTLPVGLTYVTPLADARWHLSGNTVTSDELTIAGNGFVELKLQVQVASTAAGTLQNVAVMDNQDPNNCSLTNPSNACGPDPRPPYVDTVRLSKVADVQRVPRGGIITYTFTIDNSRGTADVPNYQIIDALPPNVTYDKALNPQWGDPATYPAGPTVVRTEPPFTVPAGATLTRTLKVTVVAGAAPRAVITNVATMTNGRTDIRDCEIDPTLPDCVSDSRPVVDASQVVIEKTNDVQGTPKRVKVDDSYNYSITIKNNGDDEATGIIINDRLPLGLAFAPNQDSAWRNPVGRTISSYPQTVDAHTERTLTLRVTVQPGATGKLKNVSVIDGTSTIDECDIDRTLPGCGVDDDGPTVDNTDVKVTKTPVGIGANDPVKPGQKYSYTITAVNNGTQAATGVQLIDKLPAGLQLDPDVNQAAIWSYNSATRVLTSVNTYSLPAGGRNPVTLQLRVQVLPTATSGTPIKNIGTVVTDLGPETPIDDCVTDPTLPGCYTEPGEHPVDASKIEITKTNNIASNPPVVRVGEQYVYMIQLRNTGTSAADKVVITDQLPAGVRFAARQTTNDWASTVGNTAISNEINLAVGGTRTLSLDVVVDAGAVKGQELRNVAAVDGTATPAECLAGTKTEGCAFDNRPPTVIDRTGVDTVKTNSLQGNPPRVKVGDKFFYTITVTNNSGFPQPQVVIGDDLPSGLILDSSVRQDTRWTITNGGQSLRYTTDMAVGQVVTIRIYVEVAQGASGLINNAGFIDTPPPPGECEVTPRPPHCDPEPPEVDNVTFTKSSGLGAGARVKPGQVFTYTFSVYNSGAAAKAGYVIVDKIPAGLIMDPSPQSGWNIQPGTGTGGAGTVIKSVPFDVGPGERLTKTLRVQIDPNAVGGTVIKNVATVDGGKTPIDECIEDPTREDCVEDPDKPIVDGSDITLRKTNDVTQSNKMVRVGDTFTYAIEIHNQGDSVAEKVTLTDLLPVGLRVASGTQDDRWALPAVGQRLKTKELTLNAGETITLRLRVDVIPGARNTLTNAAAWDGKVTPEECLANPTLSGCGVDMNPVKVDNTAIAATKTASIGANTPVKPGQTFSYTFLVTNSGSEAASGVKITDKLPAGLELVPNADFPTGPVGGIITSRTFNLAAVNGSATLTLNVKVSDTARPGTVIKNVGSVIKPTDDGPTPDECEADPTLPQCVLEPGEHPVDDSNITITKTNNLTGTPPLVSAGQEFSYDLVVRNSGTVTDTKVRVTDLLPQGLEFWPTSQGSWVFSSGNRMATHPEFTLAGGSQVTLHLSVRVGTGVTAGTVLKNVSAVAGSTSGGTDVEDCVTDDTLPGCGSDKNPPRVDDHRDVEVKKTNSLGPDPNPTVRVGDSFTYTITATNKGATKATRVKVSDTLPAGLALDGIPSGWQLDASGTLFFYVDLDPGQVVSRTITVRVVPGATGTLKNKAVKDDKPVDCDVDPTLPECDDNPPTVDNSKVVITKVSDLTTNRVKPGQEYTYTITAANTGTDTAKNVVVSDTLPAGLDYVPVTGDGWTLAAGGGSVSSAPFDLAPSTNKVFKLKVKVRTGLQPGTVIKNSACTTGMHTDVCGEDENPPTYDDSLVLLTKTNDTQATGRQVRVGDVFTYTIEARNTGATTADGVVITDKLPVGLEFYPASGQSGWASLSGRVAESNALQIKGNSSVKLTLQVRVQAGVAAGTELKNASATGEDITPDDCLTNPNLPGCGVDEDPPKVVDYTDISITKTSDKAGKVVKPGDTFTYRIVVRNGGTATAYNVPVSDTLPAGLEFNGTPSAPWVQAGNKVTATIPTLTSGQSFTLTLAVKVSAGAPSGAVYNVAVIGDRNPEDCDTNPNLPGCGRDPEPPVIDGSDVQLSKANSLGEATTVKPGQTFTYTITAVNRGTGAGTNVKIADKVPAGIEFYPASQTGWTYDSATRLATTTISTLPVGGRVSVTMSVRVAADVADGTALRNAARVWDPRTPDVPPDIDECLIDPTAPGCGVDPKPPYADRNVMVIEKKNDLPAGTHLVSRGQPVGYDITVRNTGYLPATGVSVADRLPAGLAWRTASQAGWASLSGVDATAQSFTVPAGGSVTVHVETVATKTSTTLLRNVAALTSFQIEGSSPKMSGGSGGNVSAPTGIGKSIAQCVADPTQAGCAYDDIAGTGDRTGVTVTKSNSTNGVAKVGDSFTYTLTVANNSTGASSGITLSDTLPTGLVFDGPQDGWTIAGNKATLAAPFDLAKGESRAFTLRVKVTKDAGASVRNVAVMDDRDPDDCLVNPSLPGCGVDPNPPVIDHGESQLQLTKTATRVDVNGDGRLSAGDQLTYSFVVTNTRNEPVESADISITDPMLDAAGIRVVCPTQTIPAGGTVTCTASRPYVITAADVARGYVRNSAVATVNGVPSSPATYEVTLCAECNGGTLPTTGPTGGYGTLPSTGGTGGSLPYTGVEIAGTILLALALLGAGGLALWRRRRAQAIQ